MSNTSNTTLVTVSEDESLDPGLPGQDTINAISRQHDERLTEPWRYWAHNIAPFIPSDPDRVEGRPRFKWQGVTAPYEFTLREWDPPAISAVRVEELNRRSEMGLIGYYELYKAGAPIFELGDLDPLKRYVVYIMVSTEGDRKLGKVELRLDRRYTRGVIKIRHTERNALVTHSLAH